MVKFFNPVGIGRIQPWHGLSYASLRAVAIHYTAAGAEVWSIPEVETASLPAERRTGP